MTLAPSGRRGATVTSGWRVEVSLIERIRARAGARGMSQSGWLEEASLAHLDRDPLVAADLAGALRSVLVDPSPYAVRRAYEALDAFEAVTRV